MAILVFLGALKINLCLELWDHQWDLRQPAEYPEIQE
jgi:hypothetical protein